ncbi:MAG: helix-turn-helix domain-containing protein, partial [Bacteroidota bacterium]
MPYPLPHDRPIHRLVENRTTFGGQDVELAIYDTLQPAEFVALEAAHPLYCGMVTGEKQIHVDGLAPFPFLPTESLVLAPDQRIHIDFPGASTDTPTTCLTVEIERGKIQNILGHLDEHHGRHDRSWAMPDAPYAHFGNPMRIEYLLGTLTRLFTENPPYRDALIDLNVTELTLRMLQTQARVILLDQTAAHEASNGLAAAVAHVRSNVHRRIDIEELATAACMSEASLYRYFSNELGLTPLQFVHHEQMKEARRLLSLPGQTVTGVSLALGFRSISHFIRLFRRAYGITPKQY